MNCVLKEFKDKLNLITDSDSEGTDDEEDALTELTDDDFDETFENEFELFKKYFKFIKKNSYILSLIQQVNSPGIECEPYENGELNVQNTQIQFELPGLMNKNKYFSLATENIELCYSIKEGHYIQATKKLNYGDIVLTERGLVDSEIPNCDCVKYKHFRCSYCNQFLKRFIPCISCDVCLYCDESCRVLAWTEYHRWECYGLQRHFWCDDELTFIALRLMYFGAANNFYQESDIIHDYFNTNICFSKVKDNYRFFFGQPVDLNSVNRQEINQILHQCARSIIYLIEKTEFFQWFYKTYQPEIKLYYCYMIIGGILVRHCLQAKIHAIPSPREGIFNTIEERCVDYISHGIYAFCAAITKDCSAANVDFLFRDNYIIVKALKPIKEGEKITAKIQNPFHLNNEYMEDIDMSVANSETVYTYKTSNIMPFCTCNFCRQTHENKQYNTVNCPECNSVAIRTNLHKYLCSSCKKDINMLFGLQTLTKYRNIAINPEGIKQIKNFIKCIEKLYNPLNIELIPYYAVFATKLFGFISAENPWAAVGLKYLFRYIDLREKHTADSGSLQIALSNLDLFNNLVSHKSFKKYSPKTKEERQLLVNLQGKLKKVKYVLEFYFPRHTIRSIGNILSYFK